VNESGGTLGVNWQFSTIAPPNLLLRTAIKSGITFCALWFGLVEKQMVDPVKGLSEIPQMLLPDSSRSKNDLGDLLLNYLALGLLIFVVFVNIYGIVTILRKLIRWSAERIRQG